MTALHLPGGAPGQLVYVGGGFMPARLLLAPVGARLPPGVHAVAVAAVPATVGSGSRAMGRLVARAAAGAGHGVPSGVVASLSIGDATNAGALASLSVVDATNAGALAFLSTGDATNVRALAPVFTGDATNAGVTAPLSIGDATNAGVLSVNDSTRAAAGGPARGSAGGGGLLFLGGDASASAGFGFGMSSAVVASGAGGRASRGARLVVAATAGSEADGGDDGSAKGASFFYGFITTQGLAALGVVDELVPPTAKAELPTKLADVKEAFETAVMKARERSEDKKGCAVSIMRGWYGIVQLTHAAYRLPQLPDEEAFLSVCTAPIGLLPPVIIGQPVPSLVAPLGVPEADADLVRSVEVAVAVSQGAARAARAGFVENPDE